MKLVVGKCYRHTSGTDMSIICEAETTVYGKALIAEGVDGSFWFAGTSEWDTDSYVEISREEWMKHFKGKPIDFALSPGESYYFSKSGDIIKMDFDNLHLILTDGQ